MTSQLKTLKSNKITAKIKIGMISLGCPKTLVDSEVILGKLDPKTYQIMDSVPGCDVVLLNTCSFIHDAQKESVDRILELVEMKKEKQIRSVVVMGCLVQEFPQDLKKDLKEVDAFVGSGEYHKIPEIVQKVMGGEKIFSVGTPGYLATSGEKRVALTPRHYRYLKISEGCDHICSFCTIPSFRGKHRSRPMDDVIQEARRLSQSGAKELILTGQDTSYFGKDTSGNFLLPELLRRLDLIEDLEWIRLLYVYPSCITPELIEAIARGNRICKYLDMPLQHASDKMLTAMRRGITKKRTVDLIRRFRDQIPDLAIRTTFIVGFPGETESDFQELLAFMSEMKFERLGIFTYSNEEASHAASLSNQVPEEIKQKRFEKAMLLQQKVSRDINRRFLGKSRKVLIEEYDMKRKYWVARSEMDAPDVDGNVFVQTEKKLPIGSFHQVKIIDTQDYDLVATL